MQTDDNIAAVASASGGALRGIVRASGPTMVDCLARCFRPQDAAVELPTIRRACVIPGKIPLAGCSRLLECDAYFWPTARSYTRQPTVEIHTLGSPPLLQAVVSALCTAGARPARPGEFTLRAFLAGRLDLTQAEAVLGVIDAANRRDFARAIEQLAGGLGSRLTQLRSELLDLLAHLEAGLDFGDEDIEFITPAELERQLSAGAATVAELLARMTGRGETAQSARAVLVGLPNVGKSSLFNALLERGAAIVSHAAGTTRDYLTAQLDLDGLRCELVDTAGVEIGSVENEVPQAAQQFSAEQRRGAHIELFCLDASRRLTAWEREELQREPHRPRIVVWTKTDMASGEAAREVCVDQRQVETSSTTGAGLASLRHRLREAIGNSGSADCQVVETTAERSRESLRLAAECLDRARQVAIEGESEELVAAELRTALAALGDVVGAVYTDDILDRIFSRFCIGK